MPPAMLDHLNAFTAFLPMNAQPQSPCWCIPSSFSQSLHMPCPNSSSIPHSWWVLHATVPLMPLWDNGIMCNDGVMLSTLKSFKRTNTISTSSCIHPTFMGVGSSSLWHSHHCVVIPLTTGVDCIWVSNTSVGCCWVTNTSVGCCWINNTSVGCCWVTNTSVGCCWVNNTSVGCCWVTNTSWAVAGLPTLAGLLLGYQH